MEIAEAVRRGEVSAREVVDSHLARIADFNPSINAVTQVLSDSARQAAESIDHRRASGETLGPLAGVPFTVKENIDIAGVATTHGVPKFRDNIALSDSPSVARLRRVGAIPIGHSNMPDMTIGGYTTSQLYGETLNPWGTVRNPSGTSGGDGAAVAGGLAALGLGNDSGGSVRGPAMAGGITALNPTYGRIPCEHRVGGQDPTLASQLLPKDGPLARTIGDLRVAFEALAGGDPRDPRAVPVPAYLPQEKGPTRVAVVADPAGMGVHPKVRHSIEYAADALSSAGYAVEEVPDVPPMAEAITAYLTMVSSEFSLTWPRLRTLLTDKSAQHMELTMNSQPTPTLDQYLQATATRYSVVRDWLDFLETYPLLLGPVTTDPISDPPHGLELDAEQNAAMAVSVRLCSVTSFVGLPAVAVPTPVQEGVPAGVQIIGRPFREDMCLSAAEAIEETVGVLTPVSQID
jgi:amidase